MRQMGRGARTEYRALRESTRTFPRVQEEKTVPESSSFVIVLTTMPSDRSPDTLAATLVEERLAACVNILPAMQSLYRWEGRVERASEHQLVIKTRMERVEALTARLTSLHPYEVPEVLVLPIRGGATSYLDWIQANA